MSPAPASGMFRVALTFDVEHPDRPTSPGVTEQLIAILDREGVRATTFIQGRWAEAYPELAAAIAAAGHGIGNHSFYHVRMPLLTREGFSTDVADADAVLGGTTGIDPKPRFRFPFGAGHDDPELIAQLAGLGYRNIGWDIDGYDWDEGDAAELGERVVRETLAHGDGAVVLLHGWPQRTAEALPTIITALRNAGAQFVTVDAIETPTTGFPAAPAMAIATAATSGPTATSAPAAAAGANQARGQDANTG